MNWELLLSITAIIVTAIIGFFTWVQNRKNNKLQGRIVELEEQREIERKRIENSANINASIDFEESTGYRFPKSVIIRNYGMAPAENLKVEVNGKPPSEVSFLYTKEKDDVLEVLPTGDYYDYPFDSRDDDLTLIEVTITYDDPATKDNKKQFKLRL